MALVKTPESQAAEYVNRVASQFTGMGKQLSGMIEKGIAANANAGAPAVTSDQLKAQFGECGLATVNVIIAALAQTDITKLNTALAALA